MSSFIAIFVLSFIAFLLSMALFQAYGPLVFFSVVIAILGTIILNQDTRIEAMEKMLGIKEDKEKTETMIAQPTDDSDKSSHFEEKS